MRGDEFIDGCRFGGIRRTDRGGEKQISQFGRCRDWKNLERIRHHVRLAAVRQLKLDGHAAWVGIGGPVRNPGKAAIVGKAYCPRNRAAVENRCFAERSGLGRSFETALHNDALGVKRTKSCMCAKHLIHRVDDLHLDSGLLREGDSRTANCECGNTDQELAQGWPLLNFWASSAVIGGGKSSILHGNDVKMK